MGGVNLYDEHWDRTGGISQIYAMVRDPITLFVYFEVEDVRRHLISKHFHCEWGTLPLYLVVYDVTGVYFDGCNAPTAMQIQLNHEADNWHIRGLTPDRNYVVDLATTTLHNQWFSILRSNVVHLPPLPKKSGPPKAHFASARTVDERVSFTGDSRTAPVSGNGALTRCEHPYESIFDGYHMVREDGEAR